MGVCSAPGSDWVEARQEGPGQRRVRGYGPGEETVPWQGQERPEPGREAAWKADPEHTGPGEARTGVSEGQSPGRSLALGHQRSATWPLLIPSGALRGCGGDRS